MLVLGLVLTSSVINTINAQITYIGTSTANASSGQSFSINKPTGVNIGDVMIMSIAKYSNGNTNTPFVQNDGTAGWTVIYSGTLGGSTDRIVSVMYKVVSESWEPVSYTVVPSSWAVIDRAIASIVAYSGADSSTPLDASGTFVSPTNNGSTIIPSGITTAVDNAMVLLMGFNMRNVNQTAHSFDGWAATSPAAFSELFDNGINMVGVGAAGALKATAGATGNGTITLSGNTQNRGGMFLALRPSPPKQFRTKYTGNWTDTGLWEQSTDGGSTWVNATSIPTNADGLVTILSGHTITIPNGTNATASELAVNGTITVIGNATITPGTATFNSGGIYRHNRNGGTIISATWDANSTCIVNGVTNTIPGGLSQTFGDLTWQCYSQSSNLNINNSLICQSDFTITSTNSQELRLANDATDRTLNIAGDFTMSNGTFILNNSNGNGTTAAVNGNYTQTGGNFYICNNTGDGVLNINGNLSQSGGVFDFYHAGISTGQGVLNLGGNLAHSAGTQTMYTGGMGARNGILNFVGSSTQTVTFQNVDGATWVTYNVSPSSTVELQSNIELMGDASDPIFYADFVVDGIIDFGVYSLIDGANQTDASHFVLNSDAKLITANSSGMNGSLPSGTMNLSFSSSADYEFQGATTGTFTTTPTAGTVADLTINNSSGVTLSQPLSANNLIFVQGTLTTTSTNVLTINSASGSSISGYGASSYVNGPLNLEIGASTNGTYIYPIGDGSYNPFELVDFNSTGTMILQAEVTDADCGGIAGSGMSSLNTNRYWQVAVNSGGASFTSTKIRLTESSSLPSNAVMGFSSTLAGSYDAISTSPPVGSTILSDNHSQQGYFAIGQSSNSPTLSVNPSFIDFGYVASGNTDTQSFTLTGINLDGTDVILNGNSIFQLSLDGSTFSNSVTISGYGISISQPIDVQFGPTTVDTNYNLNITINGGGASSSIAVSGTSILSCTATGTILMERWDGITGTTVANLTGDADYPENPTSSNQLTSFEIPTDVADNYGVRIRGYICAPASGDYVFWIASDDNSQLWLSTDDTPGNRGIIAYVDNWTDPREWNPVKYASQRSSPITLIAGQQYYIEALMKEGWGGDNLAVGWAKPGESTAVPSEVIPGTVLSPYVISITTETISGTTFCAGDAIDIPFTISGTFNSGNIFTAQLSNAIGSFASPVNIGTLTSTFAGTINATIPGGQADGTGYLIRVVSSDPVVTGTDNGSDISIGSPELITSPGSQCKYGDDVTVAVSASSSQSGIFRWYSDAAGTNLLQESASNESSSEYTVTISSSQTYYVEFESGGCSTPITPVNAYAIIPPTLNATAGGTFCEGSTVYLYSDGSGYDNIYWEGPNSFYSTDEDPVINNATTGMSGIYTVYTNSLSGVNLVTNGDFEQGNTDFTSSYSYVAPTTNALWPEGYYTIVDDPNSVHDNFAACGDHTSGSGQQMVINGATTAGVSVWSQTVNVVPNTYYQFTYWIQSVVNNNPSELQLYVNGVAAGPVYTADLATCSWKQFLYNWDSGSATTATLSLVNQNTIAGGNDFALDDIVFQHTCTAEASVDVTVGTGFTPDITISADPGETICDGDLLTFTATPINGGTNPTYQWYLNGTAQTGETSDTYATNSITDGYDISCEMTSNLACISGSATVTSSAITMSVVPPPTASAGANLTSCGTAVVITNDATASDYNNIEWTTTGTGVFSDANSLAACTYTPSAADISAGNITLTLTAYGNTPCGNSVSTKTLTFVDPVDVSVASNNTNYCPQFLPPVSFNNDDDPRAPGYTEVQFTVTRNNTSAAWTIFTDFTVTAVPSLSGLDVENVVVTDEGDNPITVIGANQYNINTSNNFVTIRAQVLNQPGYSLEVGLNIYDVEDANGCQETLTTNNDDVVDIYPMPAIGKFE